MSTSTGSSTSSPASRPSTARSPCGSGRPASPSSPAAGANVYSSDVRIRVAAIRLLTYPDLSVACGERQVDPIDPQALVDPVVLVDVLSPSTEVYDCGEKLRHYQPIPSLREALLVAHDRREVEIWPQRGDGWERELVTAGGAFELPSIAAGSKSTPSTATEAAAGEASRPEALLELVDARRQSDPGCRVGSPAGLLLVRSW